MNADLIVEGLEYRPIAVRDPKVFYRVQKVYGRKLSPDKATVDYIVEPEERFCQTTLADFAMRVMPRVRMKVPVD